MERSSDDAGRAAWGAVGSLAAGVFALATAEFLPATLLTPIATTLRVSPGAAGQAVTTTAAFAAIAGPALVITTARIDRRTVVCGLTLLLVVSDLVAAAASSLWILLAARVGLGIALGGMGALVAALCLRLAPGHLMPRAMAVIFSGMTVASIFAPAFGAYVGALLGWHATFLIAAGIGAVALALQTIVLPPLAPTAAAGFGGFAEVLRRRTIVVGLAIGVLLVSGYFAGFTYVRPFLERVGHLDAASISLVLLALGVGGFAGNLAGGVLAGRSARLAVGAAALTMAAAALALLRYGSSLEGASLAAALWGVGFGATPIGVQTWTVEAAPDRAESVGAAMMSTLQVAIAVGAVVGGLLVDRIGARGPIACCALASLAGAAVALGAGRSSSAARSRPPLDRSGT